MLTDTDNVIAQNWKLLKCPSTTEWLSNLWYIYSMEFTELKMNEHSTT